jgi:hypothetical protein
MESLFELNLKQFDEVETERRRDVFLSDMNRYLSKLNPELMSSNVLKAKNSSKSVLDVTGVRIMKVLGDGKTIKAFVCISFG